MIYSLKGLNLSVYKAILALSKSKKGLYSKIAQSILDDYSESNTYMAIVISVCAEIKPNFDKIKHLSSKLVGSPLFRFIRLFVRSNIKTGLPFKHLVFVAISEMLHLGKWRDDDMKSFERRISYIVKGKY